MTKTETRNAVTAERSSTHDWVYTADIDGMTYKAVTGGGHVKCFMGAIELDPMPAPYFGHKPDFVNWLYNTVARYV